MSDTSDEPLLKYSKLSASLTELLDKDNISCLSLSDRFMAIGTHWGTIHLMDLIGTPVKTWKCHTSTVNNLCIDNQGDYIASAGGDGTVIINSLYSTDQSTFNFKRPVSAVALEPDFGKKTSRQFVSGGTAENLLLSGKGWFGNNQTILHSGEGRISSVSWNNTYIVWSNEKGTNIYDVMTSSKFGHVEKGYSGTRGDLFRSNIAWKDSSTFLIGWGDSVKMITIKERPQIDVASGLSPKYVEVVHQFKMSFVVCGLAPFNESIILLGYDMDLTEFDNIDVLDKPMNQKSVGKSPEVYVVDLDGEVLANDEILVNGAEMYQPNDYRLEFCESDATTENTYYIMSPKDIIVAKPRDINDHVDFLVQQKRFKEALETVEINRLQFPESRKDELLIEIGQKQIKSLLDTKKYESAAELCPKILGKDVKLWEKWIYQFAEARELKKIYPYIPINNPRLPNSLYELILTDYMTSDLKGFYEIIKVWPVEIYAVKPIAKAIQSLIQPQEDSSLLYNILVEMFTKDKQLDRAVYYGMLLSLPRQLEIIEENQLYGFLYENSLLMMQYDFKTIEASGDAPKPTHLIMQSEVAQLLVHQTDHIPPSIAVKSLQSDEKLLHIYLDALFLKDPLEGAAFHSLQVSLYAEYDPSRLIDFLRISSSYSYPEAYQLCLDRDLVPEMIYLLGKMGKNSESLKLIIQRVGDVNMAIEFAKEQNDQTLWEEFIKFSMDKPKFIVGLLENLGSHISPLKVIERIPSGLAIPGLKAALIQIMTDCSVQVKFINIKSKMSLREGCEKILHSDTWDSLTQLTQSQRKGVKVSNDSACSVCHDLINNSSGNNIKSLLVRLCCSLLLPSLFSCHMPSSSYRNATH
ncbi:hypothetical protein BC833DRAFT_527326 [Globomyces pollinis-pini]|nr:hypothetical protein BC833DRAFT_527326 [Globomyces pollinis-pini]